ncbi:dihydroorotate dehydrogenase [Celeribacter sp. SCSIO 80788]|uniref:dihydroorotate dehydrogenase n=1 Tax=Celeribacter sp. SCSIO 80788 TaxID=3117013 RepID=UPI003DA573C3
MTNRDDKRTVEFPERELEALFKEARRETMLPSGGLMERILADAESMIDTREATEAARLAALRAPAKQRHPLVVAMVAALGGWRAVAGLATAGVAGLAIGLGTPTAVTALATGSYVSGTESYDTATSDYGIDALLPSFYELAVEG